MKYFLSFSEQSLVKIYQILSSIEMSQMVQLPETEVCSSQDHLSPRKCSSVHFYFAFFSTIWIFFSLKLDLVQFRSNMWLRKGYFSVKFLSIKVYVFIVHTSMKETNIYRNCLLTRSYSILFQFTFISWNCIECPTEPVGEISMYTFVLLNIVSLHTF